ncbi:MAG: bifunctional glutamate N-acetyltransferase/amino-acid acetyltransferase ArgJ [Planctomycetes bacterium]|nr:bifunctional glutamate N-acetyltransferase/amino-acid acetyltransferase ArgJ [Planctomycetota bacterium]
MEPETALPAGFRAGAVIASVKLKNTTRPDLALLVAERPSPVRAVFTRNELVGAHIHLCREHLARSGSVARAVVVNSGNANCATGKEGVEDARAVCRALAEQLGCPEEQVLMISTGVIGARLPMDRILARVPELVRSVRGGTLQELARAIMTTDTFPKAAAYRGRDAAGTPFHVAGVAKGAGMIHPDMATMLGFLLADALPAHDLALVLRGAVDRTFHRVTVDGDTSPNDTVLLWCNPERRLQGAVEDPLAQGAEQVGRELCRMIAADGEGATRRITVQVQGAPSERDAAHVGRVIATSPLVKTAVHGRDPNWGRILAAAGRSGVAIDVANARIWIGGADLYSGGRPHPENEPAAHAHMRDDKDVILGVDLASGPHQAEVWTCDYSADYVRINADYRS